MVRPTRVVLDVDTGIDDALALLYAVASPTLDLCGVTTVAGNVPVEVAARNSAAVLALAGAAGVPVAVGASRTTAGEGPRTAPSDHGPDGLGGVAVPPGAAPAADVESLVRDVRAAGPFTLVGLAPMTNLPGLAPSAAGVVLVGGTLAVEDPPEVNAGHDPEATARTLASGRPTTLYVRDVFEQVSVLPGDVERLGSSDRAAARLAGELLAARRSHLVGDAGALVLLTCPELFGVEARRIGPAGGHLVQTPGGQLVDVVVDVDAGSVARTFVEVLLAT
ncbi:nucleoside hydrolase [Nocardioides eburneiflavus]|uniref:nucleoside hydrolase n=1 Tax=Nocardioides eburneiflavus TaxID=2518372 RepID=UPI00143DC7FE|nr:nucleoside hydrolase [Nocardioides eburneiflavus]